MLLISDRLSVRSIKMDERTKKFGNRMGGLVEIAFGGMGLYTQEPIGIALGTVLIATGVGDIVTGEHVYLIAKVGNYLSNKIRAYRQ